MSYEIITSINIKEKTVSYYPNNVYPRFACKAQYNKEMTDKEFISSVLVDTIFRNYHISNKNSIFNIVVSKVCATDTYKDLEDKIWNLDGHYTKEYCKEHYDENIKALRELAYGMYLQVKSAPKEEYVLTAYNSFISKINKRTYQTTHQLTKAKVFASKEIAEGFIPTLGDYWKAVKKPVYNQAN